MSKSDIIRIFDDYEHLTPRMCVLYANTVMSVDIPVESIKSAVKAGILPARRLKDYGIFIIDRNDFRKWMKGRKS